MTNIFWPIFFKNRKITSNGLHASNLENKEKSSKLYIFMKFALVSYSIQINQLLPPKDYVGYLSLYSWSLEVLYLNLSLAFFFNFCIVCWRILLMCEMFALKSIIYIWFYVCYIWSNSPVEVSIIRSILLENLLFHLRVAKIVYSFGFIVVQ